ncbi:hypothetical protein ASF11_03695 [Acidovorax sp. Leaf76]|uniref:hypothetical protein n=1 Tax=unclassified Acidovorax TaxID=2684926 RepID=UPI0006F20883|nr:MULTISPECIES: hypothetical protein [unclassified Acidovorax]KQO26790.1 hypothetical protein ASF11_03695 [Acidovorax sp. Leaf76]KQO40559.1 hypothetical protein ASF19_02735 [Acidovorax sp. Leaf84]KQS42702.1 hypothetical protein ASG27_02670 [Acidovorax sp. Leaf191]
MPNALLKYAYGSPVPGAVDLVEGNVLRVKLEAIDKRYTLVAVSDYPHVLELTSNTHNSRADSWTFEVTARSAGNAKLMLKSNRGEGMSTLTVTPALVSVNVSKAVTFPDQNSDAGLLIRLFLAEVPDPQEWKRYNITGPEAIKDAMRMMRRVIVNRLESGSAKEFMAAGAGSLRDIVTANDRGNVQFEGFAHYPSIANKKSRMIDDRLAIVNDATNTQWHAKYVAYYEAALAAATEPLPPDPSPTGLFAWKTAGSSAPSPEFVQFKTLGGNTFFTHKRLSISGR